MNRKKMMQAINFTSFINLTYTDQSNEKRTIQCVPIDIKAQNGLSPSRTQYEFIAVNDVTSQHITLSDVDINDIQVLEESFDPGNYVKEKKQWLYPRDWGIYS